MESNRAVKILLVDDQPSNLLALEAVLGGGETVLVKARSGEEALRRVLDEDFAVILMDVQMPRLDGLETAALIRQRDRSKSTPIIFLTAFTSTDTQVSEGYALGAVDFLSKPIQPAILRSKVAVFVELFEKTEQVRSQAARLVENQRREHEQELIEQRQRWEVERLKEEAAREKKVAEALAQKAEELAAVRDELAVQLADMTRLHALGARLANSIELKDVLDEVLSAVTSLQGTGRGVLMLYDRERDVMTTAASVGFTPEQLDTAGEVGSRLEAGSAITAIISGGLMIEDVESDPVFTPHLPAALQVGARAICSTPLLTCGGELVGSIATYFERSHRPSDRETRLVELYARQAAEFIDNARLYRAIREADRRKDEFLAMLAHELRNPLAPLLTSLHVLGQPGGDPESDAQARAIAEHQVRHLARLVDDLLDVSRISSGKIQLRKAPAEFNAIVARAIETSRPLIAERRHELTVSLPDGPIFMVADAARLEQVVSNLLNNAAKYTEPGGRIGLSAELEGDGVVLRIRDTGIGIAPDLLPHVFELFTQEDRSLDRSQGGLGIGLTLVKRLIEVHEGRVSVASEGPGRGSEFTVTLPVSRAGTPTDFAERSDSTRAEVEEGPRRVLVVDDNLDGARMMARMLKGWGHQVATAHDGLAALDAARRDDFDVILLDIGLPGLDGYQVARQLRDDGLDETLMIALTGYGQGEDRRRAEEAGFDHHQVKPVDPDELRDLLNRPRPVAVRA